MAMSPMLCNKKSEWSVFREYSNLFEIYSSEEIISHVYLSEKVLRRVSRSPVTFSSDTVLTVLCINAT